MSYYGLTPPQRFSEDFNIEEEIRKANKYFYTNFIQIDERRCIDGDFIFVKDEFKSGIYERFLHSISMQDKEFYNMYPCNNDESHVRCTTNCEIDKSPDLLKNLNRALCLYRLSRISWIPQIIDLANKDNPNVKVWRKEEQDKTNQSWRWKRYVRYEEGLADYILIFNEVYVKGHFRFLDFRTAYPVFMKRDKSTFNSEYEDYKDSQK